MGIDAQLRGPSPRGGPHLTISKISRSDKDPRESDSASQDEGSVMSDSSGSIHIIQNTFQIPEVPRAPPVSGPPPHITGEAIPDQGETELIVPVELWTENHRNERGDPCDRCPLCLQNPEVNLKVLTFQHRAREYQR